MSVKGKKAVTIFKCNFSYCQLFNHIKICFKFCITYVSEPVFSLIVVLKALEQALLECLVQELYVAISNRNVKKKNVHKSNFKFLLKIFEKKFGRFPQIQLFCITFFLPQLHSIKMFVCLFVYQIPHR